MAKKIHYLYMDLETTTVKLPDKYNGSYDDYYLNDPDPKYPQPYDWACLYDEKYKIDYKYNYHNEELKYKVNYNVGGDSLIKYFESINVDALIYFNNLKGFDGHFIIPLLDKHGYNIVYPQELLIDSKTSFEIKQIIQQRVLKIRDHILDTNPKIKEIYEKIKTEEKSMERAGKYILKHVKNRWNKLLPYEYSVLANGNNQVYEIKIGVKSTKRTNGIYRNRAITIRDNLLLFPSSIKAMGENIAKQETINELMKTKLFKDTKEVVNTINVFGNNSKFIKEIKTRNESIWHKKELEGGYFRTELYSSVKELEEDGNQLEYLINDVLILWKYHKLMEKHFPRKNWKMTIASTTYKDWQNRLGNKLVEDLIRQDQVGIIKLERGAKRYKYKNKVYSTVGLKKKIIGKILPTDWLDKNYLDTGLKVHDHMYQYATGGIVKVNEEYRGKLLTNVNFDDINSSYPSVLNSDTPVPIGKPIFGDHPDYKFKFYKVTILKKIVNEKGLPFLFDRTAERREYIRKLLPGMDFLMTSISYKRFLKYYSSDTTKFKLEVLYSFKQTTMKELFEPFIEHWYPIKVNAKIEGNLILAILAKLSINAPTGKFGTKKYKVSKIWNPEENEWERTVKELESKFYLPIYAAITDGGRMLLVDAVHDQYDKFVYCDTDSIASVGMDWGDRIKFHPTELGKWDREISNAEGVFRRPKQYMLKNDKGKVKLAFAGINFNRFIEGEEEDKKQINFSEEMLKKVSFREFITGKKIPHQLNPYRLMGHGVILYETIKSITPIWDFPPQTEQKYFLKEHFDNHLKEIDEYERRKNE